MVRNSFSLSAVCGGAAASSKLISSENALLFEFHSNPILCDTMFSLMNIPEIQKIFSDPSTLSLMNIPEIQKIFSDPSTLKELGSFVNKLHPDFIKSLPDIFNKYQNIYGGAL